MIGGIHPRRCNTLAHSVSPCLVGGLEKYLQQCILIPEVASSSVFCHFVEADAAGTTFDPSAPSLWQHSLKRVCTRQGYLLKRGRKVCSWKRRYFCICGGVLYYYYTAEIANPFQPLGVITLQVRRPSCRCC